MLERIAIITVIILSAALLYLIGQRALLRWRAHRGLGFSGFQPGRPAILYFTAPGCVPCMTIQRPALDTVRKRLGDRVQIFEFDASRHVRLANQWAVLSVPTTFLIDPRGRPRKVNNRAMTSDHLIAQLRKIAELPENFKQGDNQPLSVIK